MSVKTVPERDQLKRFEPLGELSDERLDELISLSYVEKIGIGVSLFREGEIDNQTLYLLSGDVQLTSSDGKILAEIKHLSEQTRFPLDDSQPHQCSCTAMMPTEVIRIDNSVLDYMMMWDQMAVSEALEQKEKIPEIPDEKASEVLAKLGGEKQEPEPEPAKSVSEPASTDEPTTITAKQGGTEEVMPETKIEVYVSDKSWIRKMQHIMAFKNMPPANIKYMLESMEPVELEAGDTVVRQGDEGDYYYVLVEGQARVTRTIELATLEPGQSFGEEALISGSKRNASVSMTEKGTVMRLAKKDFNAMLKEPMLSRVNADEARQQIKEGAQWLDIRHVKEFNYGHLPGAINIPLHELRLRLNELDKSQHYICYCRTGHRSSAATFLLAQAQFHVNVLSGGVQVMAQDLES